MSWLLALEADGTIVEVLFLELIAPLPFLVASRLVSWFLKPTLLLCVFVVSWGPINFPLLTNFTFVGGPFLNNILRRLCIPDNYLKSWCLLDRHKILPWISLGVPINLGQFVRDLLQCKLYFFQWKLWCTHQTSWFPFSTLGVDSLTPTCPLLNKTSSWNGSKILPTSVTTTF